MADPVFEPGDVVVCIRAERDGQGDLITGNEYIIYEYDPAQHHSDYTWPAYVVVRSENDKKLLCHADRFRKKEPCQIQSHTMQTVTLHPSLVQRLLKYFGLQR